MKYRGLGLSLVFLLSGAAASFSGVGCKSGDNDSSGGAGGNGGASSSSGKPPTYPDPDPLPALSKAPLTTEERLTPVTAIGDGSMDPRIPENIEKLLKDGYGDEKAAPGEPVQNKTLDGTTPPADGANKKLLTRLVHLTDTQLADDESPTRVATLDGPLSPTAGAYRPQEGHECNILNAAVRTINKVHEKYPVDFVLSGGDNADNAQTNEVQWFMSIMDGNKRVECDSGADNDPTPGAMNDPKDPFFAEGLKMPWYWVTGNHDVLSQGNFTPAELADQYVGNHNDGGTRDWSQAGGPVVTGDVVADANRKPLIGADLLKLVIADKDGHGVSQASVDYGRGFYAFDAPGGLVRVIVTDTTAPSGGAEAVITKTDVDKMLKPLLDDALGDGKLVIVTSHHTSSHLTDGSDYGGKKQENTLTPDDWRNLLGSYPNVIMHLGGHTHLHYTNKVVPVAGGHSYWEMETSALADFIHEMRIVEIWDLDNGFIGIKGIALDYQVEGDPIAADGRKRGIADYTSGWQRDGSGLVSDRNVMLYIHKP